MQERRACVVMQWKVAWLECEIFLSSGISLQLAFLSFQNFPCFDSFSVGCVFVLVTGLRGLLFPFTPTEYSGTCGELKDVLGEIDLRWTHLCIL